MNVIYIHSHTNRDPRARMQCVRVDVYMKFSCSRAYVIMRFGARNVNNLIINNKLALRYSALPSRSRMICLRMRGELSAYCGWH